jgi:dTMP kinase
LTRPDRLPPGRFITLEGGEGAGKSTQARLLVAALRKQGLAVLLTREPGGAPGAEVLRSLLLSGETEWSAPAEALLHFAARAEHVERTIKPALAAGNWIVCDRFSDSTMAYQGYGQGADKAMIGTLAGMMGVVPDLTVVLNVSEPVAEARRSGRGGLSDRYERRDAAFHARVRQGFLSIAASAPGRCVVVDADRGPEEVLSAVLLAVRERLGPASPGPRQ